MDKTAEYIPIQKVETKDRSGFLSVLKRHIEAGRLAASKSLLVLGASDGDASVLRQAGWSSITLSNFSSPDVLGEQPEGYLQLDAEAIELPDNSFESVAAYEVLHHCRSPHRALCEMLRVSRRYVFLQEPNDSFVYTWLQRFGFISRFEIPAVVAHAFVAGGVRNTGVPNFIYRWNHSTAFQTATSFLPERVVNVHSYPYWELNHTEFELSLRLDTRIGIFIKAAGGPANFRRILGFVEKMLNALPVTRKQGNQFFCCIEKTNRLHDWLLSEGSEVVFNRSYR